MPAHAARFWHYHAENALQTTEDTELKGLINKVFDGKSPHAYRYWLFLVHLFGLYWVMLERPCLHTRDAGKNISNSCTMHHVWDLSFLGTKS